MYTGTAFKRSMESPPLGLINTCIPGPRVEPDISITIEEIGYLSPGVEVMMPLSWASRLLVHWLMPRRCWEMKLLQSHYSKGKCFTKEQREKENKHTPNTPAEHHSLSASNLMVVSKFH
ncbi:uncharacterized protein LOC121781120 [Salvia splendens]|uniref:uncharacterized protein LOC121781120 n=1 Tax=Salvia splendens TaxID=180675 RepID=UPI001C27B8FC|nr:uncharacterized protein LOC121781120 [Salvia splendens]